ncbi:MFS transporter [Amycolatopsis rhabdoformis]|uniref:MFS transporter n=1 Tax=Amycolatopsis rhabdoformis TaxID=1448059 RepID=A0ABZ1IIS7_9PSEU|nr:MFS transporter [Amycolatopsis rhabdoformis]WSE34078.1 MFS transporter [Amycolatopsis rhabdoformis]
MSLNSPATGEAAFLPADGFPRPSKLRAWTATVAVIGATVVTFLDKALVGLIATPVQKEFGLTATEFGTISSASYLLLVAACLVVGLLSDRLSPRVVLLVCGVLWAVGQIPAFLAVTGFMLVASRLVVGAAEGPVVPLSHTIAYSWFPNDRRGLPASLITSGAAVAKVALLPVLTVVVVAFGWRSGFLAVGILALAWVVVWFFAGRMGPYTTDAPSASTVDNAPSASWLRVLLSPTFLVAGLVYFAQNALASVIYTWLPSYFEHGLGFSATASGLLYTVPSAMAIIALVVAGTVTDRLLRRGVSSRKVRGIGGGITVAVAGVLLTLLPWTTAALPAILLLVFGYGTSVVVNTVTLPVVAEIAPARRRAGTLAVLAAIGSAAGIVSPLVTGVILDATDTPQGGYTTAFLLFGGFVAVSGLLFAAIADPEREKLRTKVA